MTLLNESFSKTEHDWRIEDFFADESGDPLTNAFHKPIDAHPGSSAKSVAKNEIDKIFKEIHQRERKVKTCAYVHVPFCESHCLYCGFYRKRYDDAEQSRQYADALITDLNIFGNTPCQTKGPVHAVYIGGGTPTALEASDLKRILLALCKNLPLANDCEITVEGRIRNFGPKKMEACLEGGANRFSIGVQTFDTNLRQSMGRLCAKDEVIKGLIQLSSYDEAAVIIDLIYGFPGQTMEMWESDIKTLMSLELDGADLYQLKILPETPLAKAIEKGKMPGPSDRPQRARMYARGVEMMDNAMFRRLTVNHWGRTSRERNIYNHMVKGPSDCLAFGPGAGGNLGGHFFFIESDYDKWRKAVVEEGRKPVAMMNVLSEYNTVERTITSELELCRIKPELIGKRFGLPLAATLAPLFQQWTRAGLMGNIGDWNVLTTAGQFWQVNIAQLTINYLHHTLFKENYGEYNEKQALLGNA
ncbi:MAG: heme anaerobic degradation radical SAM methyltransferase ChuW/HutW [Desulforegulaceae bacterium]|nr:heme anaerobic degradation radical SAM methyltransferase ChuW/HutW [Desulforegulaceae bacterium]